MVTDPRSQQFWNEHADGLREEISEVVLNTIFAGVGAGVDGMPGSLEALVDWDVVNRDALSYLETYLTYTPGQPSDAKRWRWLTELTETTRRDVVNEINGWVERGDPLSELELRLEPIFGKKRAEMIASTEVTRIYAEGNLMAWKSTGFVEGKRWQTAVDDLVCPICGPLHGIEIPIDAEFEGGFSNPPAHPRCRCWIQPITIMELEEV